MNREIKRCRYNCLGAGRASATQHVAHQAALKGLTVRKRCQRTVALPQFRLDVFFVHSQVPLKRINLRFNGRYSAKRISST
jgi:hypothetical protein